MVDLSIGQDLLRCNPDFWGRPRYDYVIVNLSPRGQTFAKLISLFMCTVGICVHPLALVQSLDHRPRSGPVWDIDKKLSLHRWNLRPQSRCEIIPVRSIVRGALLIPDANYSGDHFVVDTVDTDMFLRIKHMHS